MAKSYLTTKFLAGQGLGNQLWAYAATRSISEYLGFGFLLRGLEEFKGSQFLEIAMHANLAPLEVDSLSEVTPPPFFERQYFDSDLNLCATHFDERVISIDGSRDLQGYFQSENYFFGNIKKLRNYIKINPLVLAKNSIPKDVCVLNIRGGEYKRFKDLILPYSYWKNAVENIRCIYGVEKFIVVTDDYRYGRALFPSCEIISGNIGDCYAALNNAQYIIASNSSFSYFPIKTNTNSPVVIAPQYWSRFGNPYQRWAAPSNFYVDWHWQDNLGNMVAYDKCLESVEKTSEFYKNYYYIQCHPEQVRKNFDAKKIIPQKLRILVKKILSVIFPKKFG